MVSLYLLTTTGAYGVEKPRPELTALNLSDPDDKAILYHREPMCGLPDEVIVLLYVSSYEVSSASGIFR